MSDLDACRTDLTAIVDLARWAYGDGFQQEGPRTPKAPNPDNVTGPAAQVQFTGDLKAWQAATADEVPDENDYVPGAKYDIGVGNYRRRRAYQLATVHLARAAVYIAVACRPRAQPPLTSVDERTTLNDLDRFFRHELRRLTVAPTGGPYMRKARRELDRARTVLEAAFSEAPDDTPAPDDPTCRICEIREPAKNADGRCSTCHRYWYRNKRERPKALDGVAEAKAAGERRRTRGDGWGDESGSCTQPLRAPDDPADQPKGIR